LALQFLSSRYSLSPSSDDAPAISSKTMEGAVLWISCAPVAEKQIMMGLRKGLQHNLGGGGSNNAVGPASSWMGGNKSSGGMGGGPSFGSQGGIGNSSGRIHIVSIPLELADAALTSQENEENFSHEAYLKRLHQRVVHWLNHRELSPVQKSQQKQSPQENSGTFGPNLIIMDNATTLGTLFGDRLAGKFLSSVRSSLRKYTKESSQSKSNSTASSNASTQTVVTTTNLLAIRASSPDDGGLYQIDDDGAMKGEKLRSEYARLLRPWLGFGSGMPNNSSNGAGTDILQVEEQSNYLCLSPDSVPSLLHRSGIYEVADGIVDVSPLESGYARDVLGRLSFATTWSGKGWWGIGGRSAGSSASMGGLGRSGNAAKQDEINGPYSSICVNYRCDDSGVRVMRLRSR